MFSPKDLFTSLQKKGGESRSFGTLRSDMKTEILELEPCKRLLKIEIPEKIVEEELDRVYDDIRKVAELPGFRKGKVPRNLLERHYSKTAKDEVLKKLIPSGYSKAIEKHNLSPISLPKVNQVRFVDNQPLYFEVEVDIRPEVRLRRYKGLKIKRRTPQLTDKDVEESLNILRERYAEYKPVEKREIKEGDYVIVNYETSVDGKVIDKREGIWFNTKFNKGKTNDIIKNLIGAKIGDEIKVDIVLPKDYFKKEYAEKGALMKIKVREIREKHLPQLNEEFVKNLGNYETLNDLKQALREDIRKRLEEEVRFELENQLSDILIKSNPLDVPASMVKEQTEELVKSAMRRLIYQGLKEEDVREKEEALRNNLKKEAEKQVKIYFILDSIAKEENIKVSDEDIKKRLDEIAERNKTKPDEIREYLTKNDSMEMLNSQILHEKVIDFLLNEARIKDI